FAHEVDRLLGDDLPGHHDREAGRIRNDEIGGDEIGAALQPYVNLGIAELDVFAACFVVGGKKTTADVAFVRLLTGVARYAAWKCEKFGRSGTSVIRLFTRAWNVCCSLAPPCASRRSISVLISSNTRIRWATSLRVLLMLDCSRTELRDVLLSWMLYSLARM